MCEHPLLALNLGKIDGKYKLKLIPTHRLDFNILSIEEKYGKENLLLLPCGKCAACKVNHQKQFAVRCALEAKYYKDNCMVTLTYKPELRPRKLIKRDLQEFIKRCRNAGIKFRYYGCGEYGSDPNGEHAPHYHLIMFGYWPEDARVDHSSKSGFPVYTSKKLTDLWHRGIVSISEMAPATAAYVAGYVGKKLGLGEFTLMSTRPGIGARYIREHLFDVYQYDNIVGAFGVASVPRYFDKIADQMFYDLEDIKKNRVSIANSAIIESMMDHKFQFQEEVYEFNGRVMRDKLNRKRRGL